MGKAKKIELLNERDVYFFKYRSKVSKKGICRKCFGNIITINKFFGMARLCKPFQNGVISVPTGAAFRVRPRRFLR